MFSEIAKIKTGGSKQPSQAPQNMLSMAEARANLEVEFGDLHAIERALKMLGERQFITPQVRERETVQNLMLLFIDEYNRSFFDSQDYKRLTVVIPKISAATNMNSERSNSGSPMRPRMGSYLDGHIG